ncbi:DUF6878 family protein [Arvimicrobium flavum]|uniref:DUF6878 family protein n=1 Tax=Arvimicrobium flavum TaxID=3393320 RepID=UPI00237BC16B|nr:DUF6878 family protein [Mesorhizobium shangrilense]
MTDSHDWLAEHAALTALAEHRRRRNRDMLIAVLAEYGVATATIEFDGSGDEGQIESVTLYNDANEVVGMPAITVSFTETASATDEPATTVETLDQALERFAYDALCDFHSGWQDNDGGYGTVTLCVAAKTATLDFNGRYTASDGYIHDL